MAPMIAYVQGQKAQASHCPSRLPASITACCSPKTWSQYPAATATPVAAGRLEAKELSELAK
jgi:hypothetical protein